MRLRFLVYFFISVVICVAACKKNNDNVFATKTYTKLNFVNAGADTLNLYLNGTRQNNGSSLYPGGVTNYITLPSGSQNYQFKKAGNPNILFSFPLTIVDSTNTVQTSLFVAGESADKAFTTNDFLPIDTNANTTLVRFINATPDVALDFTVDDSLKVTNTNFKSNSGFLQTGSGNRELKLFVSGNTNPIIDTTVTFATFTINTIYSRKTSNGTVKLSVVLSGSHN